MQFESDPQKAASNLSKHGVTFAEASSIIFDDPMFITLLDEEHSVNEERYITIGLSVNGHLFLVAHTHRPDSIRIISARKVTKNEQKFYAEAE